MSDVFVRLKNLPIIPSQTSQIFTHYSYFIPIAPSIISIVLMIYSNAGVTIFVTGFAKTLHLRTQ